MGLFGRSKKEKRIVPEMPKLPELPRLPSQNSFHGASNKKLASATPLIQDLPRINNLPHLPEEKEIHQLPSFPNNSLGEKFSQNTIKNAVEGNPEISEEEMMKNGPKEFNPATEPLEKNPEMERRVIPKNFPEIDFPKMASENSIQTTKVNNDEPIFIRIDRFEESMKIFNSIKEKVSDMEHLVKETKEIKEKEQIELSGWEEEVLKLKSQIEKVDKDIFSKIK